MGRGFILVGDRRVLVAVGRGPGGGFWPKSKIFQRQNRRTPQRLGLGGVGWRAILGHGSPTGDLGRCPQELFGG